MKKWLIRLLLTAIILIIICAIAGYFFLSGLKPDYDEEQTISGLSSEVDIYYDNYGVPHIYAQNTADAYQALGYTHAKDRLWQMDIMRRIAPGRLAELFGAELLENDKFFRTIGTAPQTEREVARFKAEAKDEVKEVVLSYIDGVNAYIENGPATVEHTVLGLEMEPFTLEDVYNIIGYMSFSFSIAHQTEPILDYVNNTYGEAYLRELDVHVKASTTFIQSESSPDYSSLSTHVYDLMNKLPVPELIGSNSWVIGPSKSKSGSVLFANDPHIGYSQPCVWYEAHITTPQMESYGYYIAGFPYAQIGHNRHHAVGLTMFENDDVDFYRERSNPDDPTQYWATDQWLNYETRTETIGVKDGEDVDIQVRATRHGPILSDVIEHMDQDKPAAMWWIYQKFPLRFLESSHLIVNGKTLEEVRQGASLIHSPGLNVMYGDVEGNVAWWAVAKLPKRPAHVNSKLILDGSSGADEVLGYYEFEDNPQAINPTQGYVYSANNQSLGTDSTLHPGYYLPEDRARRITTLINAKDDWEIDDFKKMLLDVTSENTPEIIESVAEALIATALQEKQSELMNILKEWDGAYDVDKAAPTIYVTLIENIMRLMTSDELGDKWGVFNGTHVMKRSIQPMIASNTSPWWDDRTTSTTVESRADIIVMAMDTTITKLQKLLGNDMDEWRWGSIHTLEHDHAFAAVPALKSYFNVGPFELSGATEVINNQIFITGEDGKYKTVAGPSSRRAINMADLEGDSWSILPTGQSGNVLSSHYKDQAQMFIDGGFKKQLMNKEEIISGHKHHSKLSPK